MPIHSTRFCQDCRAALTSTPGPGGREAVRRNLERLLREPAFLDRHVLSAPAGRPYALRDPELGFCRARPHQSEGAQIAAARPRASWGGLWPGDQYTDMTEWRRTDGTAIRARLSIEVVARIGRLEPGHAGTYDGSGQNPHIEFPDGARSCG